MKVYTEIFSELPLGYRFAFFGKQKTKMARKKYVIARIACDPLSEQSLLIPQDICSVRSAFRTKCTTYLLFYFHLFSVLGPVAVRSPANNPPDFIIYGCASHSLIYAHLRFRGAIIVGPYSAIYTIMDVVLKL